MGPEARLLVPHDCHELQFGVLYRHLGSYRNRRMAECEGAVSGPPLAIAAEHCGGWDGHHKLGLSRN